MHKPARLLTQHRIARLIAWALAMLAWLGAVLFADRVPSRRHIRQRYALVSLNYLSRLVRKLAVVRAIDISGIRKRERPLRNTAPSGFRRRIAPRALTRAVAGARLRKALKRGDLAERIQFLIAAFADIDAFARRYLVKRALRRLTKLCAVIAFAPPAVTCHGALAPPPACADSS